MSGLRNKYYKMPTSEVTFADSVETDALGNKLLVVTLTHKSGKKGVGKVFLDRDKRKGNATELACLDLDKQLNPQDYPAATPIVPDTPSEDAHSEQ